MHVSDGTAIRALAAARRRRGASAVRGLGEAGVVLVGDVPVRGDVVLVGRALSRGVIVLVGRALIRGVVVVVGVGLLVRLDRLGNRLGRLRAARQDGRPR